MVRVITPVAVLVTATFAPATTAPLGSVTVPRTDPVMVCATATAPLKSRTIQKIATRCFFIQSFLASDFRTKIRAFHNSMEQYLTNFPMSSKNKIIMRKFPDLYNILINKGLHYLLGRNCAPNHLFSS